MNLSLFDKLELETLEVLLHLGCSCSQIGIQFTAKFFPVTVAGNLHLSFQSHLHYSPLPHCIAFIRGWMECRIDWDGGIQV